jgi:hypothetical protein
MAHNLTYLILGTSGTGQHPGGHNTHEHLKAVLKLNNKTQENTSATRTENGGLHSKSHTATRKLNHHTHNLYYKMQMSVHAEVYNKHYKDKNVEMLKYEIGGHISNTQAKEGKDPKIPFE